MINDTKSKLFKKSHIIFILIIITLFSALLLLHSKIFLSGDDFEYATYSISGLKTFIDKHIYHYNYVNGRSLIHILASIVLKYDIYLWRILNPILICLTVIYISLISINSYKHSIKNIFLASLIPTIFLFLSIDIHIARETIYWADGTFNYLYPSLVIFIIYYHFSKGIKNNNLSFIFPIFSFFACATMELTGLMCFGILLMMGFYERIFLKNKLQIQSYLSILFGLLGYLTVVLAPGTLKRISRSGNTNWTIEKFSDLMTFYLINPKTILIIGLLLLSGLYWILTLIFEKSTSKYKLFNIIEKLLYIILGISLLFVINICIYTTINPPETFESSDYFIFSILLIISILTTFFILAIKKDYVESFLFTVIGIGSQFLMVSSKQNIYRGIFPAIIIFLVPTICFINHFFQKRRYILYFITSVFLIYLGISNSIEIYKGYNSNYYVNTYNFTLLESEKENQTKDKIILKRQVDPLYTFHPIEMLEARMLYLEEFYSLKKESVFVEQDMKIFPNRVFINSEYILCNVPPHKRGDVYFLSAGEIKNHLGYDFFQKDNKNLLFIIDDKKIELIHNTNDVIIEDKLQKVSAGFYIFNGRNIVPIDFFKEYLNLNIKISENNYGGVDISIEKKGQ